MSPHDLPAPSASVALPGRLRRSRRPGGGLAVALLALALQSCDPGSIDNRPLCEREGSACLRNFQVTPDAVTLGAGEQALLSVTFNRSEGYEAPVELHIREALPRGITATFSVNPVLNLNESTLTLAAEVNGATPGTYTLTVEVLGSDFEDTFELTIPPSAATCFPWEEVEGVPGGGPYWDVDFVQGVGGLGYVAAGSDAATSRLLRTTDDGRTWAVVPGTPALQPGGRYSGVWFLRQHDGFLATRNPAQIYRTRDFGATWELLSSYTGGEIKDFLFVNSSTALVVVEDSDIVWRTTDGGDTWTQTTVPIFWSLTGIGFAFADRYVVSSGTLGTGELAYTSDGGASWHGATAPDEGYFWVDFFDTDNGIAGGDRIVARTTDGGVTWQEAGTPPTVLVAGAATRGVCTGCATVAYAVGYRELWETRDLGASWQRVCSPLTSFNAVAVSIFGPAIAVGDNAIWRRD
jgi:hypothetical protein